MPISLSRDQYELLLSYARREREVDDLLADTQRRIDQANAVRRFVLNIRWMARDGASPRRIDIGKGWPPTQQVLLKMERAIAREDVDAILRAQPSTPVSVNVTSDPRGVVGWTELDAWDFNLNT